MHTNATRLLAGMLLALLAGTLPSFASDRNFLQAAEACGYRMDRVKEPTRQQYACIERKMQERLAEQERNVAAAATVRQSNQLHHDLTTCVAFYSMLRQCFLNGGTPEDMKGAERASTRVENLSAVIGVLSSRIGMTAEAVTSRLEMEFQRIAKDTAGSCVNVIVPLKKYGDQCRQLYEREVGNR